MPLAARLKRRDTGSGTTYCAIGALDKLIADLPPSASKKDRCLAVLRQVAAEGGWPLHAAVFAAADEADIREERIVDRPPLDPAALAGAGPVTLLGDALHPMVPSIGAPPRRGGPAPLSLRSPDASLNTQPTFLSPGFGAVSAIEGAVELAQCLSAAAAESAAAAPGRPLSPGELGAALRRYEGARLFRATSVQLQSFAQGSDSYKWGRAGGRVPDAARGEAVGAGGAPGASGGAPPPQQASSAPAAGGGANFQDWLSSYRSPWSGAEEAAAGAEKAGAEKVLAGAASAAV